MYNRIGLAVALSPTMPALVAEGLRLARCFRAPLLLLHVGARTEAVERRLLEELSHNGDIPEVDFRWLKGSPGEALIRAVRSEGIDLLVAGASERESIFRYFLGTVARTLVRELPRSLILFTDPHHPPQPLRNIVLVTDYSEIGMIAMRRTLKLARYADAEQIHVVRVYPTFAEAMALSEGAQHSEVTNYQRRVEQEEQRLLKDFIDAAGVSSVPVQPVILEGNVGKVVRDYARRHNADLLVIPTEQRTTFLERVFPSDMEWILRHIPCNLWVVHEDVEF